MVYNDTVLQNVGPYEDTYFLLGSGVLDQAERAAKPRSETPPVKNYGVKVNNYGVMFREHNKSRFATEIVKFLEQQGVSYSSK